MIRQTYFAIAVAIVAVAPLVACADSYGPYPDRRVVDPTGRHYVVLTRRGGPLVGGEWGTMDFVIAEARAGSPAVKPAVCEMTRKVNKEKITLYGWYEIQPNPDVAVRKGDIEHGRGTIHRPPGRVIVSSTGLGFAMVDLYGYNDHLGDRWEDILKKLVARRQAQGWTDAEFKQMKDSDKEQFDRFSGDRALTFVSRDGKVKFQKTLFDLFSREEIARFPRSVSTLWWSGGGWIDDQRRKIIIVGVTDDFHVQFGGGPRPDGSEDVPLFRVVDMATGKVAEGFPEALTAALADGNSHALHEALYWTIELKVKDAKPHLPVIFKNKKHPVSIRLKAAVAMGLLGDRGGIDFVKSIAQDQTDENKRYREYAKRYLPVLLGQKTVVGERAWPSRTWVSRLGKHRTEARCIACDWEEVILKKKDGSVIEVPVDKLSPADQRLVRARVVTVREDGLVEISIGAKQGVQVGHRLEVYRIDRREPPRWPKRFVSRIEVVGVKPDNSTCKAMPEYDKYEIEIGDYAIPRFR